MSSAVPRTPSGPGWFWARVSTMNAWLFGTWSGVFGLPSGPRVRSGSSARSGTNTVPPLLNVWSTPWSKNCPKNVNSELYGGERPTSVVTLGMKSVLCDGTQSGGEPTTPVVGSGSTVHGCRPGFCCDRTGNAAAATAAGFVDVWSTTRLLITRGCESYTFPFFCAYELEALPGSPTPKKSSGRPSAGRKTGDVRRGNGWSAVAKFSRAGKR